VGPCFPPSSSAAANASPQAPDTADDYDDIWSDYDDDYTNTTEGAADSDSSHARHQRIDFGKYGKKNSVQQTSAVEVGDLPADIYCGLVTTLKEKCVMSSLLEMWRFDEAHIESATQQEILDAVNLLAKSPWFGYERDFASLLGGVERNSSGHIVAARTSQMIWSITVPDDVEIVNNQGSGLELDLADRTSLEWEEAFVQTVLGSSSAGFLMIPNAAKSFGDVSSGAIFFDTWLMGAGYAIMFTYTILVLGKLNSLEVRLYLSIAGITGIFMGLAIAMGLSSLLGFPYTPMHGMLPFLCLGIGIDDMFVIVQCWGNLRVDPATSITEKMGLALQHAGVSITVTSLTDIFAFGVGAISTMPGLQSFCVSTAFGLAAIFLLQISWFVAWMSLDEARVAAGRDGVLPCVVHPQGSKGIGCTAARQSKWTLATIYGHLLSSRVFKALTLIVTLGLFCVGAWGWSLMRMHFDPVLLLPGDSYLRRWVDIHTDFYPDNGWTADVYSETLNHTHLADVEQLVNDFEALKERGGLRSVNSWWTKMKQYAGEKENLAWQDFATEEEFPRILSDFLFSPTGATYKNSFIFESPLTCSQPAPRITASKFSIGYYFMNDPELHIPARGAVTAVLEGSLSPYTFSHTKAYAAWETDEIIGFELWRNIALAMACVFIVTLVLLANVQICVYVICIVGITLTDIVGFLHFWDITIDIISCVNIVLAIGLCVDYSVHIGLAYMVAKGSRQDKAVEAIASIGPAVFNGGFTTFLAIVLCIFSYSHVFLTFFKVFVLTVMFGLFHGLVLFPVILATIGPLSASEPSQANSSLTISSGSGSAPTSSKVSPLPSPHPGLVNIAFVAETSKASPLDQSWVSGSNGGQT
jgi:predicted RND superfamily exporter protein